MDGVVSLPHRETSLSVTQPWLVGIITSAVDPNPSTAVFTGSFNRDLK